MNWLIGYIAGFLAGCITSRYLFKDSQSKEKIENDIYTTPIEETKEHHEETDDIHAKDKKDVKIQKIREGAEKLKSINGEPILLCEDEFDHAFPYDDHVERIFFRGVNVLTDMDENIAEMNPVRIMGAQLYKKATELLDGDEIFFRIAQIETCYHIYIDDSVINFEKYEYEYDDWMDQMYPPPGYDDDEEEDDE